MEKQKVHLVLGSGGARGVAHIGVIEVLEESGFEIISVTGCSMGAVVGGIYAAGFQASYKEWMLALTKGSVFSIMDFTFTRHGFLKGERIFGILKDVTGHHNIEDLPIAFTAVAADMLSNREVHYTSGDLYKALRASIAIPGIFTPVLENGAFLVDGGVLNPLPLNLVKRKEDEIVVAVNLNGPPSLPNGTIKVDEDKETMKAIWNWLNPILQDKTKQKEFPLPEYSIRELLITTYRMTQDRVIDLMLQAYPPDILIEIPRDACGIFEFYKAKTLIELGREMCSRRLSTLLSAKEL
jgi:NTE family protein